MSYQSSLSIDSVIVVESLGQGWASGKDLFETTIAPRVLGHNMVAELYQVSSRSQFLATLRRTLELAQAGRAPILHIEAHGAIDGLDLGSGESLDWAELVPHLTEINRACRMNFLVVAAACHGWYLGSVLRPVDRSPVWGVLGPAEAERAGDLYAAMRSFYDSLLTSFDVTAAIRATNAGADMTEWAYRITSAEILFCNVFRYYMQDLANEETQEQRVNRLVADIARAKRLDVTQTMRLRAEIGRHLGNHKWWYNYYRTGFLMLDLFPENAARFPLTFEDCLREAA